MQGHPRADKADPGERRLNKRERERVVRRRQQRLITWALAILAAVKSVNL